MPIVTTPATGRHFTITIINVIFHQSLSRYQLLFGRLAYC